MIGPSSILVALYWGVPQLSVSTDALECGVISPAERSYRSDGILSGNER